MYHHDKSKKENCEGVVLNLFAILKKLIGYNHRPFRYRLIKKYCSMSRIMLYNSLIVTFASIKKVLSNDDRLITFKVKKRSKDPREMPLWNISESRL